MARLGRRSRLALFASVACVSLVLGWALIAADTESTQELTGIAGMFAGLWSLGAAIAQLLPQPAPPPEAGESADRLAATVQEQWWEEVAARQLRNPRVIPLSWAATRRPVSAPPETVFSPVEGRVLRLSLQGRLEGDFSSAAARLAEGYRQVSSGRLVVLGEPGAGKTVLALMLTLGLLADRPARTPVPVLLSVSSWDPVSESLDDWIVGTLATSYYGGRSQVPRLLLERQMLLPVLDGLDEIPDAARRSAVRAVNEACGDGRGVVVTCRSAEYQDVIEGGSPTLRRAPVVEVAPVAVADAVAYLSEVNWPEGVDWEPVYAHVREHPDGPVAAALSTPLALSLARAVYRHCDRDPAELLGFDGRHAAEDHLVDHIIPAAYAPPPGTLPGEGAGDWQREARQAERWLTYLATYLHRHRERDLAWWLMSSRLLSRWVGLLLGIGIGLLTMLVVTAVRAAIGQNAADDSVLVFGLVAAVLTMLTWYAVPPDRPPGRVSLSLGGSLHRLRGGFRTGFLLASLVAVPLLGIVGTVSAFVDGWSSGTLIDVLRIAASAFGAVIAMGLAFAVHEWLDAPSAHSTRATPLGLVRQDRKSSLVGAGLAGTVLGAGALPLIIVTVSAAYMVFLTLTGWSHEPRFSDVLAQVTRDMGAYDTPKSILAATVLPGAAFAVLMLLPRAWPRFALLRVVLAARGHLPWRFVRFLSGARERQLLRQSAGTYQFRHIRLQERLASRSLARDRMPPARNLILRRRRLRLAVTGAVVTATCLLLGQVMPRDTSHTTLLTDDVAAMGFGPSGTNALVTVDYEGAVRRWDTHTGEVTGKAKMPVASVINFGVVAAREGGAAIYLNNEGVEFVARRLPWTGPARLTKIAADHRALVMSTGGRLLLIENRKGLVLRNTRTGRTREVPRTVPLRKSLDTAGWSLALSDNGKLLAPMRSDSGAMKTTVTDTISGKRRCELPGDVFLLATDAAGSRFATTDREGNTVRFWDSDCHKEEELSIPDYAPITAIALAPNGRQLAVTGAGVTRLYDQK